MKFSLIAATLFIDGCAGYTLTKPATPPLAALAAPASGVGQICVVRPHWTAAAVTFVVHDNDVLVGATRGPSYFCYNAEPGLHRITSKADSTDRAEIDVAAGQNYYLHQVVQNVFGHIRNPLAWIASDRAAEMIDKCGYRVLTEVPGNESLPESPPTVAAAHD